MKLDLANLTAGGRSVSTFTIVEEKRGEKVTRLYIVGTFQGCQLDIGFSPDLRGLVESLVVVMNGAAPSAAGTPLTWKERSHIYTTPWYRLHPMPEYFMQQEIDDLRETLENR